jgi:hypothetical protein
VSGIKNSSLGEAGSNGCIIQGNAGFAERKCLEGCGFTPL